MAPNSHFLKTTVWPDRTRLQARVGPRPAGWLPKPDDHLPSAALNLHRDPHSTGEKTEAPRSQATYQGRQVGPQTRTIPTAEPLPLVQPCASPVVCVTRQGAGCWDKHKALGPDSSGVTGSAPRLQRAGQVQCGYRLPRLPPRWGCGVPGLSPVSV